MWISAPAQVLVSALATALGVAWPSALAPGEELPVLREASVTALARAEREAFVAAHNGARKAVGVEPVAWSEELAAYALESLEGQKEALIAEAKEGWEKGKVVLPKHRKEFKFGENVAAWIGSGGRVAGAEYAVRLWLGEKAAFDRLNAKEPYKVGDEGKEEQRESGVGVRESEKKEKKEPIVVGHYTQVVWRETKRIGAAKLSFELVDGQGKARTYVMVVGNYEPAGNRVGERPF